MVVEASKEIPMGTPALTKKDIIRLMDSIRAELRENGRVMGGINPKLSTYTKLQKKNDELNNRLNELRAQL